LPVRSAPASAWATPRPCRLDRLQCVSFDAPAQTLTHPFNSNRGSRRLSRSLTSPSDQHH